VEPAARHGGVVDRAPARAGQCGAHSDPGSVVGVVIGTIVTLVTPFR
jgi:hypothetical protein